MKIFENYLKNLSGENFFQFEEIPLKKYYPKDEDKEKGPEVLANRMQKTFFSNTGEMIRNFNIFTCFPNDREMKKIWEKQLSVYGIVWDEFAKKLTEWGKIFSQLEKHPRKHIEYKIKSFIRKSTDYSKKSIMLSFKNNPEMMKVWKNQFQAYSIYYTDNFKINLKRWQNFLKENLQYSEVALLILYMSDEVFSLDKLDYAFTHNISFFNGNFVIKGGGKSKSIPLVPKKGLSMFNMLPFLSYSHDNIINPLQQAEVDVLGFLLKKGALQKERTKIYSFNYCCHLNENFLELLPSETKAFVVKNEVFLIAVFWGETILFFERNTHKLLYEGIFEEDEINQLLIQRFTQTINRSKKNFQTILTSKKIDSTNEEELERFGILGESKFRNIMDIIQSEMITRLKKSQESSKKYRRLEKILECGNCRSTMNHLLEVAGIEEDDCKDFFLNYGNLSPGMISFLSLTHVNDINVNHLPKLNFLDNLSFSIDNMSVSLMNHRGTTIDQVKFPFNDETKNVIRDLATDYVNANHYTKNVFAKITNRIKNNQINSVLHSLLTQKNLVLSQEKGRRALKHVGTFFTNLAFTSKQMKYVEEFFGEIVPMIIMEQRDHNFYTIPKSSPKERITRMVDHFYNTLIMDSKKIQEKKELRSKQYKVLKELQIVAEESIDDKNLQTVFSDILPNTKDEKMSEYFYNLLLNILIIIENDKNNNGLYTFDKTKKTEKTTDELENKLVEIATSCRFYSIYKKRFLSIWESVEMLNYLTFPENAMKMFESHDFLYFYHDLTGVCFYDKNFELVQKMLYNNTIADIVLSTQEEVFAEITNNQIEMSRVIKRVFSSKKFKMAAQEHFRNNVFEEPLSKLNRTLQDQGYPFRVFSAEESFINSFIPQKDTVYLRPEEAVLALSCFFHFPKKTFSEIQYICKRITAEENDQYQKKRFRKGEILERCSNFKRAGGINYRKEGGVFEIDELFFISDNTTNNQSKFALLKNVTQWLVRKRWFKINGNRVVAEEDKVRKDCELVLKYLKIRNGQIEKITLSSEELNKISVFDMVFAADETEAIFKKIS